MKYLRTRRRTAVQNSRGVSNQLIPHRMFQGGMTMRRKAIAQSLFFSSALTLAAAAVTVQAADTAQSQPPSDSGQTMQQQATAPDTATGSPSGTAVGDDTQSATGPSAGDPATPSSSEQTAALGSQQDSATVEPIPNEDELAELSGKTVVNMEGEEIGEIDSIVRDRSDQSLKAVIRSGGFFGIGGDKVAVAAEDLQLQDDDTVRLNTPMTKEELQQTASAFDEQNYEPIGGSSQQATGEQAGAPDERQQG